LGAEPDVSAEYFVEAIPTAVVIDRQGKIVFREMGAESPQDLVAAVLQTLRP